MIRAAGTLYALAGAATFLYLTLFDGYAYTWWNWPIALLANAFLGATWPVYWLILRPIFGI